MSGYDVVVVGGGHAGCEAAYAAARRGCRTLMLAIDARGIGAMSCNPAIGGVGKGHLVREIDVFGGIIPQAADSAAIHFRMLNSSKGPAVRGPRVQADRTSYRDAVRQRLATCDTLTIAEAEAVQITTVAGKVAGLRLRDGSYVGARSIVLAAGTFLAARLFRGEERMVGGRLNEGGAHPMADCLRGLGFSTRRFKTGTPPRLDGRTIDWARLDRQASDDAGWTMSAWTAHRGPTSVACAITRTTPATHDVIRDAMPLSPLFGGAVVGRGPRYCPSIEDKVHRFGDRDGHQIFLEPESLRDPLVYPNGLSTSLPTVAQEDFIRTIPGLENCDVSIPGYAVEYDAIDTRQSDHGLMARDLPGLFLAGQVNGTTGYEEAAAQGLVAGMGASAFAFDTVAPRFDRDTSYIGVMVDDLVLQETSEPYRMLTARAENRMALRADNAERRLGPMAKAMNILTEQQVDLLDARRERHGRYLDLHRRGILLPEADQVAVEVMADRLYEPYLEREERVAMRGHGFELRLEAIDFARVRGLSTEMIERLSCARPETVADAARIAGITPAAVTALMIAAR